MTLRVGIVGTGSPDIGLHPENATTEGFAVAYRHAPCYQRLEATDLVGCADVDPAHREAFAGAFDLPAANAYASAVELVEGLDLDLVAVCTPVSTHADIVVDCARTGVIDAIHCEKPMAATWGGARRMAEVCDEQGVQLTINHQRRFGEPFRAAKRRLDAGEIGRLERLEIAPGAMFSYGTHAVDLCGLFNDEQPAAWVLGQVDYRRENVFSKAAHNENQVLAQWRYDNGVFGLAAGGGMVHAHHRLIGTDGVIEVGPHSADTDLRLRRSGQADWAHIEAGEGGLGGLSNGYPYLNDAIADVVDALIDGGESELSARHALKTTEILFATYESARRRGRVDLPLEIDDNPLVAMVESGELNPRPSGDADDD